MITPYELLARFNRDGTIAGCHVRTITTVDGKDYENDPIPLKDATDPAFVAFATSFSVSAVSERDALVIDKAKLTTDLATKTAQHDSIKAQYDTLVIEKVKLISDNAKATTDVKTASDKVLAETQANHAQIILAKDADFDATRRDLSDKTIFIRELDFQVKTLSESVLEKDIEITRLKAAFNPSIPTPVIGETKTVSITVDATAWDGILASIYDPTLDIPAEKQATDFILSQYAGKFVAWAEKENFVAVDEQANAAKQQIKEATKARAIEVLASTKVKIT